MAPPEARAEAQLVCRRITEALDRFAHALIFVGAVPQRDDEKLGLAVVIQIGAELALSVLSLLDLKQAYGAAALLRQIVEVEYLAWALAENPAEAKRWVEADDKVQWNFFRPSRLARRSNGRFRHSEFKAHCDRGGHPRPDAVVFLPFKPVIGPVDRDRGLEDLWDDLTFHLIGLWQHLQKAVAQHPLSSVVGDKATASVTDAIRAWHDSAQDARVRSSELKKGGQSIE